MAANGMHLCYYKYLLSYHTVSWHRPIVTKLTNPQQL